MEIYERLKSLREDSDLKQEDLAKEFKIDRSTLANYENGKRKINIDILIEYADYFNVSTDYLLGREKPYYHEFEIDGGYIGFDDSEGLTKENIKDVIELLDILEENGIEFKINKLKGSLKK